MAKFKVGDKVTVRQWDDMEKQWGLDEEGDIAVQQDGPVVCFSRHFGPACGGTFTIESTDDSDGTHTLKGCHVHKNRVAQTAWFANEFFEQD